MELIVKTKYDLMLVKNFLSILISPHPYLSLSQSNDSFKITGVGFPLEVKVIPEYKTIINVIETDTAKQKLERIMQIIEEED